MNLSYNSITAGLYRWFYVKNQMPQNLCLYFWKVVLMYFLIVPYTILNLPYIALYGKSKGDDVLEKPVMSFFMYFALGIAACMLFSISLFWYVYPEDSFGFQTQIIGCILWISSIGTGGCYGLLQLWERYKTSKIRYDKNGHRIQGSDKPKKTILLVEWVKSTYNQYCPHIKWID